MTKLKATNIYFLLVLYNSYL